ncbi:PAS domain-containing sensor histidine kinase [Roseomonas sp. SSH11]|uniref:histidine kinase n=1 Tax=Pararoseomonas baculiformis TaxID=2820812 RepID=A0ABS4AKQ5_9PROT|nr:histidine kinase dimerization/phospho-acceptor domain-containing protein [Pararoseomonas baculiformis]MBP0447628.1 PAS domain-containing sensor histidine kinase [Pararoseomonas baculiformis]
MHEARLPDCRTNDDFSRLNGETAEDLYEEAPFGYLSTAAIDGPVLQLNRTLCRWTGYRSDEIVGIRRFIDFLSPAGRIVHATRHVPLLQTAGAADGIALELLRADGSRFPVLMNSVVRRAPDGRPLLTRTALFDATAYRRYETQLIEARARAEQSEVQARRALGVAQAADQAKARFLAAMNHEFRTPISIITGFSELLVEAAGEGRAVPASAWARDISDAAAHLLELLEDATRYARLDELGPRLQLSHTNLQRSARAALLRASAALRRAQVAAKVEEGEEVIAFLDKELSAEALACCLREFGRRAGPGAELWLRCLDQPARIELRSSTAINPEEVLASISVSLDAPALLNRGLEGAGLGMIVAHRIAALHGGELRIGADHEGATTLTVSFGSG